MQLTFENIVIIALGYLVLVIWLLFYIKGKKYVSLFENLDEKDFPLNQIYFLGYAVLEKIKYQYKSKTDRKLRQQVEVIYGEKYAEYYVRVVQAQKVSISFTVLVIAFIMYGLANDIMMFLLMLLMTGVAYYYFGTVMEKKIEKRSDEILGEFSEVVSKLALLTNAGMILKEAWNETAYAGDSVIYKEMQATVVDINNGMAEVDAYHEFGKRCMIPEIKKFTSTIIQGIILGNKELVNALQQQSKEVWNVKRQIVKRKGEQSASKIMIPMFVMFLGILIMILVPIFTNLGI